MIILGIYTGHDMAACLVVDGMIVANVAEERFSRIKHDSGFPAAAIAYCLQEGGISSRDVDVVGSASNYLPLAMESRFVLTPEQSEALAALRPFDSRARLLTIATQQPPLYIPRIELSPRCKFICVEHHRSHASAAYFTRGRDDRCLIVTMDGIGDNVSSAIWLGDGNHIKPLAKWGRDASLGWFYGNVTEALGWQHGDGEGTTMGLAAYGDPAKVRNRLSCFHPVFSEGKLVRPHSFGPASHLNKNGAHHWHFADAEGIRAVAEAWGAENVAAGAQSILETQVLDVVRYWTREQGIRRLACAGGVFLNVKLNQRLWHEVGLEEHWIFPDAGDSGLAIGSALHAWHTLANPTGSNRLEHLYFGPDFSDDITRDILSARRLAYREISDPALEAATRLARGEIVGWFHGRTESGPRALGNRSILMSPICESNKERINASVKFRESFRPFCPSILFERKNDYVLGGREENFMITSFQVMPNKRMAIPAVVHIDGSLRPQTVKKDVNPLFHCLVERFGELTGEYAVLNTSFNIRGEPIVCHPREAIRCFFDTGLDSMVIGKFVLEKAPLAGGCVRPTSANGRNL